MDDDLLIWTMNVYKIQPSPRVASLFSMGVSHIFTSCPMENVTDVKWLFHMIISYFHNKTPQYFFFIAVYNQV